MKVINKEAGHEIQSRYGRLYGGAGGQSVR